MNKKFRIAVLASTRGTDLQAIIDEIKAGKLNVELNVVVSNKKDCYALERAREQGFDALFIDPKGKTREEFDHEMMIELKKREIDLVCLVGYMRILSSEFVKAFEGKIINVHPALLPKFGGKDFIDKSVHEAVIASGDKETGMTIHYVTEQVDSGPIIVQKKCSVAPDETPDSLKEKVQALEKEWYPKVIKEIAEGKKRL